MDYQRRIKLANATETNSYNVKCISETWLNGNVLNSELLLHDYTNIRSDRKQDTSHNPHGGVIIAVKNSINCETLKIDIDTCLACEINLANEE